MGGPVEGGGAKDLSLGWHTSWMCSGYVMDFLSGFLFSVDLVGSPFAEKNGRH